MTLSRRDVVKLGLGAGAAPLLAGIAPLPHARSTTLSAVGERLQARPLPLDAVRLTGGPLKHAQDLDAAYLLQLEPDRMLAYYRERAGLAPRAEPYGGWDAGGRNLTGHIAGHYLSAVSFMWAATGDERFRERADYIVDELKVVQDRHGDGYLSALEGGRRAFGELSRGEIRAASFDLNGEWSPWYTLHKTYAGLRDAYRFAGNALALEVEVAFAAWAERVLAPLDGEQIQRMLDTEFGVHIDVLSTGRFPGDDKPKPIAFPDPAKVALRGERFALLPMPRYIELKLASGMVASHRAKDLVDVQELVKSARLSVDVADELHPWVREKFIELWHLAQTPDPF